MKRTAILAFSALSYVLFFGSFLYLVGFVSGLLVPKTAGAAEQAPPLAVALAVNLALVALFGVQHSVMARGRFKQWMTRLVPQSAERSVFVLAASAVLIAIYAGWQPMPGVVWEVGGLGGQVLFGGQLVGWLIVLVSTFLIDHFELFGLRQAWAQFRGREFEPPQMGSPALYKIVRHPIYLGFLIAFWSAPTMTVGRLVFAAGMSTYILIGIRFEERDLIRRFGDSYREYRRRVGMLLPRPGKAAAQDVPAGQQDRAQGG